MDWRKVAATAATGLPNEPRISSALGA